MVFKKLTEILEDIFEVDRAEISAETDFADDLYADELDMTELAMIIEEEFDILTDDEDMVKIKTVGDLADYIKGHIDE